MSAKIQEIVPNPEFETPLAEMNSETVCVKPESVKSCASEVAKTPEAKAKPDEKTPRKAVVAKKTVPKKKSSSGIPLRLNSATSKPQHKVGSYRIQTTPQVHVVNKNTLEVQFMNNKKRLLQLHAELVEKQRPLLEMHKSLVRTKKQLEDLGKKVVLDELKVVSLKSEEKHATEDGAGETPVLEAATTLKSSIESVLQSCKVVCQKCFEQSGDVVRILESVSRSEVQLNDIEGDVQELKREKGELEKSIDDIIVENQKKIEEAIATWQKIIKDKDVSEEVVHKISDLEEKIKQQQKALTEAEESVHSLTRRVEDKKASYEKAIAELQEKINKLEEELKKEKKIAADNLMKSRNLRGKLVDLETRTKEAEEKSSEATQKLKQLQEQMRKKEIQWVKEKDDFKKNEALLQQKFTEKQSHFDTRLQEMEETLKTNDKQQENLCRTMETQMEIKDQELVMLEKERDILSARSKAMEEQLEKMKQVIEHKEKEIEELSLRGESAAAIESSPDEGNWEEIMEFKKRNEELENAMKQHAEQAVKMQGSLKAHAQLAVALKLEKDNAIKYSEKLRNILQEARDEIELKNKTIYKIHEKLVLREQSYEKLKSEIKEYETYNADQSRCKNRCQICMSTMMGPYKSEDIPPEPNVGKTGNCAPQYVSESLIGMSVKKVDSLRARLDNLKKMKLPVNKKRFLSKLNCSWSNQSCQASKPINTNLRRQIELRGKLYQILQKHADQSCEDFINLLKLTVSSSGGAAKGAQELLQELNPSNTNHQEDEVKQFPSDIQITRSYNTIAQFINNMPVNDLYSGFQHDQSYC